MNSEVLITNAVLGAVIIFALWWFFGTMPNNQVDVNSPILITIRNGMFQPSLIEVPAGKAIKLHFVRTDGTPCGETVTFPQFQTSYSLPMNQKVEVNLPPLKRGEWDFNCPLGLFRGKLIAT